MKLALAFSTGFILGGLLLTYNHPYNRCLDKGFTDPTDIGECIWLLQNQSALR